MSDMTDTTDGLYDVFYDGSTDRMSNLKVRTLPMHTNITMVHLTVL